jgi:putative membrane protein
MALEASDFPGLNASLNATSAVLLIMGRIFIAQKQKNAHRTAMIAATISSSLFLVCYLYYHFHFRILTHFATPGWPKTIYLTILGTHTVLAAVLVPMVLLTLNRALHEQFDRHRNIARWTWPVWMYVSVTGVIIYFMLYVWFKQ